MSSFQAANYHIWDLVSALLREVSLI